MLNSRKQFTLNKDILIDRFDGRAHLDYIAEVANNDENTYPEVG